MKTKAIGQANRETPAETCNESFWATVRALFFFWI